MKKKGKKREKRRRIGAHRRASVDLSSSLRTDEEEDEGGNHLRNVTGDHISPLELPEHVGRVTTEEDKVDVDGHAEHPVRIRCMEAGNGVKTQKLHTHTKKKKKKAGPTHHSSTYVLIRKAWNWHRPELGPASMPDLAIMVATSAMRFPQVA